jgi:hypothetical protein
MPDNDYVDININRHGGNKQSNAANVKIAPFKLNWRERILGFMASRDTKGLGTTRRHAADYFGKEAGQISGRFTELKVSGDIVETGVTENGFMVYRLANSTQNGPDKPKRKTLRVKGLGFTAGAVLEKGPAGWQIVTMAPYLRAIIKNTPISEIGDLLKSKGLTYEWFE